MPFLEEISLVKTLLTRYTVCRIIYYINIHPTKLESPVRGPLKGIMGRYVEDTS